MGEKRSRIGISSSLPASISNMNTNLESAVKCAKFCVGPTIESPGPTLFSVVVTDVKQVTRSLPSMAIISNENTKITTKVKIYVAVARTTSFSTGRASIDICSTFLG